MSYRSDVKIITTEQGYQKIKDRFYEGLRTNPSDFYEDMMLNSNTKLRDNLILFEWEYMKWYELEGYYAVDSIMNSLKALEEENISFHYIRLGEDYEDVEEILYDEKGELPSFYVSRSIEIDI